ncbi:MAG: tryptophan--tRNA ligase [Anaerolineales bacterium]|jgi:tryptophanyl-tRNA synthetase
MSKKRILTGDRPTGKLHLGHYIGSLKNRVISQDLYDCFFLVADIHTLTTRPNKQHISKLSDNIHEMILDYLAVGIDPSKSNIFVQSSIPEIYELNTLLGMLVSVPRLERIPSLKDMAQAANLRTIPFGLLGYPVLMASDILSMRAHLVPIGEDNLANVELARELARRFDHMYADIFPQPEHLVEGTLIGTDGFSKMSKSLNNAIFLSDSSEIVERKVMGMYTDPNRISADTPGRVDGNPVFTYHEIFNPDNDEVLDLKERYLTGQVGDVEVKQKLARAINTFLEPIRERRYQFEKETDLVNDILQKGTRNAHSLAQETLEQVRSSMGITNYLYSEVKQSNQYYQHPKSREFRNLALV